MMKRPIALTAIWAALGLAFAATAPLAAQEQAQQQEQAWQQQSPCQLEPTEAATRAQTFVTEAQEAETPDQSQAKYQEALAAVEGQLAGSDPASLIMGATAHIGLGQYEAADELLDRFIELAPECAEPARNTRYNAWVGLYNEAITAYQGGDSEAALDRFETANLIYEDPRSLNNAAFLHQQQGNLEQAITLYRRTLATEGDEEQVRSALASLADLLAAENRSEEALQVYQGYLEDSPDDVVVRIQYALLLVQQDRTEEATPIFEEALATEGLTSEQWNQVGVGLFNAEQYEDAATAFQKAHEANPYNKEALENLVASMIQADRQADAEEPGRTLIERYPYDEGNFQLLANVLAQTDRGAEALQVMQRIDDAPMVFQSIQMGESGEGRYIVRGTVEGREAGAGTTMVIPVELLGTDGSVVASQEMEIQVPAAGETAEVRVTIETDQEAAGFQYRTAGSDGIQE